MHVIAIPRFHDKLPSLIAERDCPLTMEATTQKPVTLAALSKRGMATAYKLFSMSVRTEGP